MEKWAEIRRLVWVEDRSKRSVCREFNIHWSTLQKILGHTEPPGYRQAQPRAKRKIGPFLGVIDEILESDKKVHRQQRHTARRIFERLRHEYGYLWHFTIECGGKPGSAAIDCPHRRHGGGDSQLAGAIRQTLAIGAISYDAVRVILQARQEEPVGLFSLDGRPHLKLVHVPSPNLGAYRALVAGGAS